MPTNSAQSRFPEYHDPATYWSDITAFYARMYQCYVVFVNRVGNEGEMRFRGGSHVADPWSGRRGASVRGGARARRHSAGSASVAARSRSSRRLALVEGEVRRLVEEGGEL